jgi:hypothetical protein
MGLAIVLVSIISFTACDESTPNSSEQSFNEKYLSATTGNSSTDSLIAIGLGFLIDEGYVIDSINSLTLTSVSELLINVETSSSTQEEVVSYFALAPGGGYAANTKTCGCTTPPGSCMKSRLDNGPWNCGGTCGCDWKEPTTDLGDLLMIGFARLSSMSSVPSVTNVIKLREGIPSPLYLIL